MTKPILSLTHPLQGSAPKQEEDLPSIPSLQGISLPIFSAAQPASSCSFFEACENGDVKRVRSTLLSSPETSTDSLDSQGMAAIHHACSGGQIEILRVLLLHGGKQQLELRTAWGDTPLIYVTALANREQDPIRMKHYEDIVKFLLQEGADVNAKGYAHMTGLHRAADGNSPSLAKLFLRYGASVNEQDQMGNTPLIYATCERQPETIDLLLAHNADVNLINHDRISPLSVACFHNLETCSLKFLERGANPNLGVHLDHDSHLHLPPVHLACKHGNLRLVQALEKAGADINFPAIHVIPTGEEFTPFIIACSRSKNEEVIEWLKKRGANTQVVSKSGCLYATCVAKNPSNKKYFKEPQDQRVLSTKKLALSNDIANQSDSLIIYERWDSPIFYQDFARTIKRSDLEEFSSKKELVQAYEQAAKPLDPALTAKKIRQGELVIIPAGWQGHAITLIFYRGYYVVCNRGEGSENYSSAEFYRVKTQAIDTQTIERILDLREKAAKTGGEYLYKLLPQQFSPQKDRSIFKDAFCLEMRKKMASSDQTVANCPYASPAGSIPCTLALISLHDHEDSQRVAAIKRKSEKILLQKRLAYLEDYLIHHPEDANPYLVQQSWRKIKRELKKHAVSLTAFPEIRRRLYDPEQRPLYQKVFTHMGNQVSKVQARASGIKTRFVDAIFTRVFASVLLSS